MLLQLELLFVRRLLLRQLRPSNRFTHAGRGEEGGSHAGTAKDGARNAATRNATTGGSAI